MLSRLHAYLRTSKSCELCPPRWMAGPEYPSVYFVARYERRSWDLHILGRLVRGLYRDSHRLRYRFMRRGCPPPIIGAADAVATISVDTHGRRVVDLSVDVRAF